MNPQIPQASQGPLSNAPQSAQASAAAQGGSMTAELVASEAKALTLKYQNDPYALSAEFQKLKAAYISNNFHIAISPVQE